jgi:hypothetical protein
MNRDDERPRRGDAPLELELADVPRRLPRGGGVHGADQRAAGEREPAPAGGTMAPLPPDLGEISDDHGGGRAVLDGPNPWIFRAVAIVVLAGAAYLGYRVYRYFNRPDIVAISSPYRSSAGVTIELPPGGGWRAARTARMTRSAGPSWMRAEAIFRGASLYTARELVVLVRMHAPGGFVRTIDRETMRAGLERSLQQQATAAGARTRALNCVHEDTWQPGLAEVCYGRIVLADRDIGAGAYLWLVGDDDLIGIVYATEDASLDALELMAKSAR